MSWRNHIKVHPAADFFPMMSEEELKVLADDIRQHGMKSPIVLWFDGEEPVLLDGRNRLEALDRFTRIKLFDENGSLEETDTVDLKDTKYLHYTYFDSGISQKIDPYAYVISANIHRRHLTNEQKRKLIGKVLKVYPRKSNRKIAELTKTSHPTVAAERAKLEATGDVEKFTTSIDTKGRAQPRHKKTERCAAAPSAVARNAAYAAEEESGIPDFLKRRPAPAPVTPPVEPATADVDDDLPALPAPNWSRKAPLDQRLAARLLDIEDAIDCLITAINKEGRVPELFRRLRKMIDKLEAQVAEEKAELGLDEASV